MLVGDEFWVSPWLVSQAENVIRGSYDDCGNLIVISEMRLFAHVKNDPEVWPKIPRELVDILINFT